MKKIDLRSAAVGLILGAAAVFGLGAANQERRSMEYHVVAAQLFNGDFQRRVENAAAAGWVLEEANAFNERYGFAVLSRERQ